MCYKAYLKHDDYVVMECVSDILPLSDFTVMLLHWAMQGYSPILYSLIFSRAFDEYYLAQ